MEYNIFEKTLLVTHVWTAHCQQIPNVKESSMHHFEKEVDMDDPFI